MKTAVIYARHIRYRNYESTSEQQIHTAKAFAKANGYEIINIYTDDFDEKQAVYPSFERMLTGWENAEWDFIIVENYAILGRIFEKTVSLMRTLNKKGKRIIGAQSNSLLEMLIYYGEK